MTMQTSWKHFRKLGFEQEVQSHKVCRPELSPLMLKPAGFKIIDKSRLDDVQQVSTNLELPDI